MALTDDLEGNWHLNNDYLDGSGNGHDAAVDGTIFTTTAKLGSHALSSDGIDDQAETISNFASPSSVTIGAWVRRLSNNTSDIFMTKDIVQGTKRNWLLQIRSSDDIQFVVWTAGGLDVINTSAKIFADGSFHLVMADYNSSTGLMRAFVDDPTAAAASKTHSFGGAIKNDASPLKLVGYNDAGFKNRTLHGYLDEGAIWSAVKSQTDRLAFWNGGAGVEIEDVTVGSRRRRMMQMNQLRNY